MCLDPAYAFPDDPFIVPWTSRRCASRDAAGILLSHRAASNRLGVGRIRADECQRRLARGGTRRQKFCTKRVCRSFPAATCNQKRQDRRRTQEFRHMAKRRGHGEGSITQRADGRWHVRLDLGRGADGKRRRKHAYAATQAEPRTPAASRGPRGRWSTAAQPSTPTVARFWRIGSPRTATHGAPAPAALPARHRLFLVPAFGPLRLEQLSPMPCSGG